MCQSKCSKFFHRQQCTPHISGAWKSEHSGIHQAYHEFLGQPLWLLQPALQHCQHGCYKPVFSYDSKHKNQDMTGRMTKQANARDHNVQSTVDQIWHLNSYKHFGCNGQGLHRVGTTLSVVSMQKSVRFPKVLVILAGERISNNVWLNETVTGKVWWNIDQKSSLCCTTWHCMCVLLRAYMGVMRVENFIPCEECLIETTL